MIRRTFFTLLAVVLLLGASAGLITSLESLNPVLGESTSSTLPLAEWNKTYGGANNDGAYYIMEDVDGGYALAGYSSSFGAGSRDFWLVKTNSTGNMQWNQTYGGTSDDTAWSAIQTGDGGYAIAGETRSFGAGSSDYWLVRTDSAGAMQWNQTYGGASDDTAYSVVQTVDGGYALVGSTRSFGAGGQDFWLVKTYSNGTIQWSQTYGGTGDELAYAVAQTGDGGYALAGYSSSFGAGSRDFWLVKTNSTGNMQWNQTFGGAGTDVAFSVAQTSDGGYALAGDTISYGAGFYDFWVIKTDSAGAMQWNQTFGGAGTDVALSAVQSVDGGYAIAGYTTSYGAGSFDFWLVKTYSNGTIWWNQTYGGTSSDAAQSVVQTTDGGYGLAGYSSSFGAGGQDFWLIKIEAEVHVNIPPVASFTESAETVYTGESISFNASESYDPDGTIVSYFWDFGDGSNATGVTVDHVYADDGNYTVVLTVTDDDGATDTATATKTVLNRPPVASFTESAETVYVGEIIAFNASESYDPDGIIVTYFWNFGDGTNDTGILVEHAYANNGTYNVTLTVGDDDNEMDNATSVKTVLSAGVSDVAVLAVVLYKTVVGEGFIVEINVTIENQGHFTETFNVTVYANTTEIETLETTLTSANSTTFAFAWNTTGFAKGNYTISANATTVSGETDTTDNSYIDGTARVNMAGDVAPEYGIVDIVDVVYVAIHFGAEKGQPEYEPNADINDDGIIDIVDIVIVAIHFGETDP